MPSTSVRVCCTSFSRGSRAMRFQLFAQFGDDFLQPFRLKNVGGFAQRAQGGPLTAEFALHFPQFAGLLDGPQGADHGIEEEQQHEHAVLVVMQRCGCRPCRAGSPPRAGAPAGERACRSTSSPSRPLRARPPGVCQPCRKLCAPTANAQYHLCGVR